MPSDIWRLAVSLLSAALCALFSLYTGMDLEESSREEETDSGLGVSYDTVTGFLLSAGLAVCSALFFRSWLASLSVSGTPKPSGITIRSSIFLGKRFFFSME